MHSTGLANVLMLCFDLLVIALSLPSCEGSGNRYGGGAKAGRHAPHGRFGAADGQTELCHTRCRGPMALPKSSDDAWMETPDRFADKGSTLLAIVVPWMAKTVQGNDLLSAARLAPARVNKTLL